MGNKFHGTELLHQCAQTDAIKVLRTIGNDHMSNDCRDCDDTLCAQLLEEQVLRSNVTQPCATHPTQHSNSCTRI